MSDTSDQPAATRPPPLNGDVYMRVTARPKADPDEDGALVVPSKRFFWPVLLGLILNAIPAGLAWWMWQLSGLLSDAVFALNVAFGVIWTLAVLGAFFGYGRVMAGAEDDR